jgi:hypothetical protein
LRLINLPLFENNYNHSLLLLPPTPYLLQHLLRTHSLLPLWQYQHAVHQVAHSFQSCLLQPRHPTQTSVEQLRLLEKFLSQHLLAENLQQQHPECPDILFLI